jgi:5-methylthioadenosine/S-adenosylhomocysteine deaminase
MRVVFTLQCMLLLARQRVGETTLPDLLTVCEVIEFAIIEGAKNNRLDQNIGTLKPSKEADIITLRMDHITVIPVNNVYGGDVLGMETGNVDMVFIGGKLRKSKGKLVGIDLNRVSRLAHRSRDYIVAKAGWPQTRLAGYLPGP